MFNNKSIVRQDLTIKVDTPMNSSCMKDISKSNFIF